MSQDAENSGQPQPQPAEGVSDHDPFTYHALQLLRGVLWGSAVVGVGIGIFAFGQHFSWGPRDAPADSRGTRSVIPPPQGASTASRTDAPAALSQESNAEPAHLPTTEIESLKPALRRPPAPSAGDNADQLPETAANRSLQEAVAPLRTVSRPPAGPAGANSSGATWKAPPNENSLDVLLGVPLADHEQESPVDVFLEIPAD